MNLNRLPRRRPRPEPRHTIAAVRQAQDDGERRTGYTVAGHDWPARANGFAPGEVADALIADADRGAASPDPDTAVFTPASFTGASLEPLPEPAITHASLAAAEALWPSMRERIAEVAPAPAAPSSAEVLARVIDGLKKALPDDPEPAAGEEPGAYLRAIMPGTVRDPWGAHMADPWDALAGLPCFAGVLDGPDGRRQAGLYLGDPDDDGRHVLDVTGAGWLRALIGEALEALAMLETGRPFPGPGTGPLEFLGGALFDALGDGRGDEHRLAAYEAALALLVPDVFPAGPVPAGVNGGAGQ